MNQFMNLELLYEMNMKLDLLNEMNHESQSLFHDVHFGSLRMTTGRNLEKHY
jgi:hypothetical protein